METSRATGQPMEVIKEIYNKNNMIDSIKDQLLTEKTLNFIVENANIEDVEPAEGAAADEAEAD